MVILKGILKESWDHYKHLETTIKKRLKELPGGSVFKRRIGNQNYYYLNVRKGSKVISKYLGKESPEDIGKSIRERRLLLRQYKDVKQSLQLLIKTQKKKRRG